jgi:hypothetical protein
MEKQDCADGHNRNCCSHSDQNDAQQPTGPGTILRIRNRHSLRRKIRIVRAIHGGLHQREILPSQHFSGAIRFTATIRARIVWLRTPQHQADAAKRESLKMAFFL